MAKKGKKIVKISKDDTKSSSKKDIQLKKKVIVKTQASTQNSKLSRSRENSMQDALAFGKENYKWMGIGILLMALGMILMLGGFNEDPNVFDEGLIYSFRRITLAPILILAGLGVNMYALFRENTPQ